jgi:hypothetical protein
MSGRLLILTYQRIEFSLRCVHGECRDLGGYVAMWALKNRGKMIYTKTFAEKKLAHRWNWQKMGVVGGKQWQ